MVCKVDNFKNQLLFSQQVPSRAKLRYPCFSLYLEEGILVTVWHLLVNIAVLIITVVQGLINIANVNCIIHKLLMRVVATGLGLITE